MKRGLLLLLIGLLTVLSVCWQSRLGLFLEIEKN